MMQFTPDFLAHFPACSEMLARLMHALTCMDPTSSETMFAVIPTRGHAALPHKIVTGNDLSIHLLHKNPTAGPGPRAHFSSSFLDGQSLMSRLGRFRKFSNIPLQGSCFLLVALVSHSFAGADPVAYCRSPKQGAGYPRPALPRVPTKSIL